MPTLDDARRILHDVFGFASFRPGQEAAIVALLEGRSSLAIFPTGGGKSLCYQLPALLLDGLTVVVSPLIALMKDQVDDLTRRGVAAARLDSSLEPSEVRRVRADLASGRLKILYVAPERLASERFVASLQGREIATLAVDEAHCISEWGHNFRPEYLKLAQIARKLRVGRVLALTATATPEVADSIARAFDIKPDDVASASFHRPNLEIHVTACASRDRFPTLLDRMRTRPPGPSIVYVTLQKTAEEVARFLVKEGIAAEAYHAGLGSEVRSQVQDRFMRSSGGVVVATIAFGMGIDKADIRSVIHFNLPKGLESYAQEIGRAGRDGGLARCDLIASRDDVITLDNFAHGDTPTVEAIASLVDDLLGRPEEFDVSTYDLSQKHDIRPTVLSTTLTYLELEGVIAATGPFFAEYKFQFVLPLEAILADFDDRRSAFLIRMFDRAKKARIWSTLDVADAASALKESRSRIVAALGYLEERGDLIVQTSGPRQGYRTLEPEVDRRGLVQNLTNRFERREARDVARVAQMAAFATEPGCLTARLVEHFGETLPPPGRCGHCGPCLGEGLVRSNDQASIRPFGPAERAMIAGLRAENHKALATPRQAARFWCGLASPATTKAKLTRDPRYGIWSDVPFAEVLGWLIEEDTDV